MTDKGGLLSQEAAGVVTLSAQEFEQIRRLAYEKFGLDLRSGKESLVSARLGKKVRELKLRSFRDYYRHVMEDRTGESLTAMIDALTTNHTSFFRESAHFDFLRQTVLPELRSRNHIAIWSAACSTGEEPYSIAFCLADELGLKALSGVRILATDISTRVLDAAKKAVYPAERFETVPSEQMRRYLLRGEQRWDNWYRVKDEVRAVVEFRRVNLMDSLSHVGSFPVIFCRNVMIYFDKPTQQSLVNRLAGCLEPGGYLLIGHAESLTGVEHPLTYVRPAVYRKSESGHGSKYRASEKG
jgi:chemotaxis protein methyltransferase CheR